MQKLLERGKEQQAPHHAKEVHNNCTCTHSVCEIACVHNCVLHVFVMDWREQSLAGERREGQAEGWVEGALR